MSNSRVTCKVCGRPLPQRTGRDRTRVYCGDACRDTAYEQRQAESSPPTAPGTDPSLDDQYAYEVENVERLRPRDRTELDQWIVMDQKFDEIIASPVVFARFMDEVLIRIGVRGLLEDYRYQRAVNQFVVIYFMIGRITGGDYTLPAVAATRE